MPNETMSETTTINCAAETVFAVLSDPSNHAAIDGTGWVREAIDCQRLTTVGQIFRVAMYHDNHPDKTYEMANRVAVLDPSHAIAWEPGQEVAGEDRLEFGGWIWRYDLRSVSESETSVRLSYDWSAVPQSLREHIEFPPFDREHLTNSLRHLAEISAPPR